MKNSELRIAEFSDVHCGHNITKTEHILKGLRNAFPDTTETSKLNVIFIAGDFFDRQLSLPDKDVFLIRLWIAQFLRMCKRHDIIVRVLEGTPSHDWKQSNLFVHENELAEIHADVKHVTSLSIEYIERYDINVLYIPDEWRATCEETWCEVKELLYKENLSMVDYTVMHGAFHHQMPPNLHNRLQLHSAENYLSITKHYIFVGHIHLQSVYERILSAGSFDRVGHGEEKPKGHFRVVVRKDGNDEVTFIENKLAKKYITIGIEKLNATEAYDKVAKIVEKHPPASCFRIRAKKTDEGFSLLNAFKEDFPSFIWSIKESSKSNDSVNIVDNRQSLKRMSITSDNIEKLLLDRVSNTNILLLEPATRLLRETINVQ